MQQPHALVLVHGWLGLDGCTTTTTTTTWLCLWLCGLLALLV